MYEHRNKLNGFIEDAQRHAAEEALRHPFRMPYGLGARPDQGDFARAKVGADYSRKCYAEIPGAPQGIDLTLGGKFPPVFNQGDRATCVANAAVAFLEYYHRVQGMDCPPLSRQYFYYKLKEADQGENDFRIFNNAPLDNPEFRNYYTQCYNPDLDEKQNLLKCMEEWRARHISGASIGLAFTLLRKNGICREELMPYVPVSRFDTEAQLLDVNAPGYAQAEMKKLDEDAMDYMICEPEKYLRMMPGNSIDAYRRILSGNAGRCTPMPIVFAVTLFQSYQSEYLNRTGWFSCPLSPEDKPAGGHAMLAVGYQDSDMVPGGGYLIARNSWGEAFAWDYPAHRGHARIPYAYIEHYAFSNAFSVVDDLQVPANDNDLAPYRKTAANDMRDSQGRLSIRRGQAILQDAEGRAEPDTPENRNAFKENKFSWNRR